jgi:hypothetical protein
MIKLKSENVKKPSYLPRYWRYIKVIFIFIHMNFHCKLKWFLGTFMCSLCGDKQQLVKWQNQSCKRPISTQIPIWSTNPSGFTAISITQVCCAHMECFHFWQESTKTALEHQAKLLMTTFGEKHFGSQPHRHHEKTLWLGMWDDTCVCETRKRGKKR